MKTLPGPSSMPLSATGLDQVGFWTTYRGISHHMPYPMPNRESRRKSR